MFRIQVERGRPGSLLQFSKFLLFPNPATIPYSSASMHPTLPRFQNSFHHCHLHRSFQTGLYCNSLYHNLPKSQIARLQQIQNSLARAVFKAPKTCHITPILRSLHWLKITERIEYKLLSLTYKVLTTTQPSYLHNLISVQPAAAPVLQLWSLSLVHPHHPSYGSLTVPFSMLLLVSGISFRYLSDNLGPTTLTSIHLFLCLPPHLPPLTHHCHHPSLRRCFTPGSKPSCSTNHSYPRLPFPPSGLTPWFLARHRFF